MLVKYKMKFTIIIFIISQFVYFFKIKRGGIYQYVIKKNRNIIKKVQKKEKQDKHSEEFEDTREVIRIRKSKEDNQHNGQQIKDKRKKKRSTKHYTEH